MGHVNVQVVCRPWPSVTSRCLESGSQGTAPLPMVVRLAGRAGVKKCRIRIKYPAQSWVLRLTKQTFTFVLRHALDLPSLNVVLSAVHSPDASSISHRRIRQYLRRELHPCNKNRRT
jgi:hypothetical protein